MFKEQTKTKIKNALLLWLSKKKKTTHENEAFDVKLSFSVGAGVQWWGRRGAVLVLVVVLVLRGGQSPAVVVVEGVKLEESHI